MLAELITKDKKKKSHINLVDIITGRTCPDKPRNHFFSLGSSFYKYSDGVYSPYHESKIVKECQDILKDKDSPKISKDVIYYMKNRYHKDFKELNSGSFLNLKNCMFDLENLSLDKFKSGECIIKDHDPKFMSTVQLDVSFDLEARCPIWQDTLKNIFYDDLDKIKVLQEFMGLCLTKEIKYEAMMFFVGDGSNGKSTILKVIESLVGESNHSNVFLSQLGDKNYLPGMINKLVNISNEAETGMKFKEGTLKAMVSGDSIQVDPKFKDPFSFTSYCKFIVGTNNMPHISDKTDACFRRILYLTFNRQFAKHEQDKDLKHKLTQELNGIFLWSVIGYLRLKERGGFNPSKNMLKDLDKYKKDNNHIIEFFEDNFTQDLRDMKYENQKRNMIPSSEVYKEYRSYCLDNGYQVMGNNKFTIELLRQFKFITRDKYQNVRQLRGLVRLAPDSLQGVDYQESDQYGLDI